MSSVLSSYRQKAQKGKYLLTTAATVNYTPVNIPTTVAISTSNTLENMVEANGAPVTANGNIASGTLLLDLGREAVIYSNQASISGVTSPYYKLAIYREVALATDGLGYEGAPGSTATTYWVKVWSAAGTGVTVNRI